MAIVGNDLLVLRIVARLVKGQKIHAIRDRRELTGESLRDAKRWCDDALKVMEAEGALGNKYDCCCEELKHAKRQFCIADEKLSDAYITQKKLEDKIESFKAQLDRELNEHEKTTEQRNMLREMIVEVLLRK